MKMKISREKWKSGRIWKWRPGDKNENQEEYENEDQERKMKFRKKWGEIIKIRKMKIRKEMRTNKARDMMSIKSIYKDEEKNQKEGC